MATLFTPLILFAESLVKSYGLWGAFVIAILESFIFPVPTSVIIAPITALGAEPFSIAITATAGSVIGGVVGYGLGYYAGRPLAERLFKEKSIEKIEKWYDKWGEWVVLFAAAGPIPFKLVTWGSGIFELDFRKFMLFSIIGRSFQFFIASYAGKFIGPFFLGLFI